MKLLHCCYCILFMFSISVDVFICCILMCIYQFVVLFIYKSFVDVIFYTYTVQNINGNSNQYRRKNP